MSIWDDVNIPIEKPPASEGRGSWYSQAPGWVDTQDRPGSNALGVPDEQQGIALPTRDTLGQFFDVTFPNGQTHRLQQTDVGPATHTGRGIDISAAAASRARYTPETFPTDATFSWRPASGDAATKVAAAEDNIWTRGGAAESVPAAAPTGAAPQGNIWERFGQETVAAPTAPAEPPKEEPTKEETSLPGVVGKGFVQGVVGTAGAIVSGLPTMQDQLRAGGIMGPGYDEEFQRALVGPEVVALQEAQRRKSEEILQKAGIGVQKWGQEQFPITPGAEGLTADVARGFGSLGANIALSMVSPAAGALGAVAQGQGQQAQDAIEKGATPEQITRAAHLGTIAGATEFVDAALPFLGTPAKLAGLIGKVGARVLEGVFIEGGQEGLQQFIQNAIAKGIYKPDQDLKEGVGYNALIGGIVGGAATGVMGRSRPSEAPAPPAEISVDQLAAKPGDGVPVPTTVEAALSTVKPAPGQPAPIQGIPTTNPSTAAVIVPPEGGEIRYEQSEEPKAPTFYSALLRAAETKLPSSGTPEQMLATLENQSGVKGVELEETGLRTFLQSAPVGGRDKVSKQEILEYLEENQVQVEETISTKHYLGEDANNWIMVPGQLRYEDHVAPGPVQSYTELRLSVPVKPGALAYYDHHWNDASQMDAPNVVGHVQITTRINKAGKPVAHVEGLQGQWQQLGRAVGYLTKDEASRTVELRAAQARIKSELDELNRAVLATPALLPEVNVRRSQLSQEYRAMGREVDHIRGVSAERPGQRKPPPSPFKSDWVNLLAKRVYRWAADNGYSELTWATPELAMAWNTGAAGDLSLVKPGTRKFLTDLYGTIIPSTMKRIARGYGGVLGATEIISSVKGGEVPQAVRVLHVTVPEAAQTAMQKGMPVYELKGGGPAADISYQEGVGIERISYPFREGMRKVVGAVNEFAKKFGLDAKIDVRVVSGASARVGGHTITNSNGVAWRKPDGRYEIVLFASAFKGNLAAFLSTAMHEFGHVVVWEKFHNLPVNTQEQMMLEFLNWRDERIKDGSFEQMLIGKKAPAAWWLARLETSPNDKLSKLSARVKSYHLGDVSGFHEYMADQVARWATTTAEPISVVERAWSGIGKALRFFQEWMGQKFGVETRASLTVQNWLNSFLQAAPMSEQDYMALDIRTQKQNQYYVGEASGDPDVSMPPQQPETAPIRAQISAAFGGKVPIEAKVAAAHADHINWIYKYAASILDLVQKNPNFTPLMQYVAKARDKDRVETKIQDMALGIAKAWRGLGRQMEEKLANFIDELTNMTYLTEDERKRGTVRHPTVEEIRALVTKTGIDERGLAIAVRVRQFTESLLDLTSDLARNEAMKIIDPVARAGKIDEINAKVRNLKAKPYFPFMRFGLHFVKIENANGVVTHFQTFERKGLVSAERQQQRKMEELRKILSPGEKISIGKLPETSEPFVGLPPNMLDLIRDKLVLTPSQLDGLSQLQFQLSPAQSYAHFFQHKRYVPGYSRDFLRAFSRYAFHGSRYYAKTLYVDGMRQDIRDARAVGGVKAARIADFMVDHLQNSILDVKGDYGKLKGMMFLWAMGFSPASATLNMTQTPMISFPFLASHFGGIKASRKMASVMSKLSTFYKRGTFEGMPDWQMQGLSHGIRTKRIVETQAPELAALSQGGIFRLSSGGSALQRGANQILEKSAYMFEMVEQWNRRIVFRATMQLAFENPGSRLEQEAMKRYPGEYRELTEKMGLGDREARAIVTAGHATDRTQFVYAGWARPRFMRGRLAGSIFIFKRYLQSLMFLLGSDKKFFFHYLLISAAMGGLGGIPGVEDLKNIIQAMLRFLGYNADVEKAIRTYIKDNLGDGVPGDVVLHGLARRGFGIPAVLDALGSIYTGRPGRGLDMTKPGQNIPYPVLDRSKAVTPGPIIPEAVWQLMDPSKSVGESIGGAQTQALGYGFSAAVNMWKAIADNHLHVTDLKRWEKAEPRALASLSKMYRALTEADPEKPGFTRERSGGPKTGTTVTRYDIRDPEQLMEVIAVGLGYNDLRRANEWDRIIHQSEHTKYVDMQRKALLEQYDEARRSSPQEFDALKQKIQEFNSGLSEMDRGKMITAKTIESSMGARAREKTAREQNIPVQRGNRPIAQEYERVYPRTIEVIQR